MDASVMIHVKKGVCLINGEGRVMSRDIESAALMERRVWNICGLEDVASVLATGVQAVSSGTML